MATRCTKRAQAMVELAMGMFVLALVLSSMLGFFAYIVHSLDMRRTARAEAGKEAIGANGDMGGYSSSIKHRTIEIEPFAADYVFGSEKVDVKVEVHIPNMKGSIE